MSRYNTVVISFSHSEWKEMTMSPPKNFGPLKKMNQWLKERDYAPLTNLNKSGKLASNAVLYGLCGNKLDIDEFCTFIKSLKWRSTEHVQILFWDEEDVKFHLAVFKPRRTRTGKKPLDYWTKWLTW